MPRHPDPARLPQRRRPRRTRTREILLRAPFSLVLFGLRFRLRHLALPAFGLELRGGVAALLAQAAAFGRGCDEDGAVQDLAFAGHRPSPRSCLTAATPGYSNHDPARPCAFPARAGAPGEEYEVRDRKSTRLNSSHVAITHAVFCLKKQTKRAQNR